MVSAEHKYPWGDDRRFNFYSRRLREQLGARIQKIAVSSGLSCPNRDGTVGQGGCSFCLNDAFTPAYASSRRSITEQIDEGIRFHARRTAPDTRYFAYLQSFTNTHATVEQLRRLYDEVANRPAITGLIIGTRPDCIDKERLDLLEEYRCRGMHISVEYGVESTNNNTLKAVNRGHDFECARRAITLTAERGIPVGAHLILGLPGESNEEMITRTDIINTLPITNLKLHQLQIFHGTAMAADYAAHPEHYHLFTLDDYLDLLVEIIRRLRPSIAIERIASEVPPRYRLSQGWGIGGHDQLIQQLEARLTTLGARQGDKYQPNTQQR